jgi:hypothetical protein
MRVQSSQSSSACMCTCVYVLYVCMNVLHINSSHRRVQYVKVRWQIIIHVLCCMCTCWYVCSHSCDFLRHTHTRTHKHPSHKLFGQCEVRDLTCPCVCVCEGNTTFYLEIQHHDGDSRRMPARHLSMVLLFRAMTCGCLWHPECFG